MASTSAVSPAHATQGIILMIVAMLTIPLVDGLAKYLTAGYSPLFLAWARYVVAGAIVLPFAAARHGVRVFPAERPVAHTLRTVFLIISMTLYLAFNEVPGLATLIGAGLIAAGGLILLRRARR